MACGCLLLKLINSLWVLAIKVTLLLSAVDMWSAYERAKPSVACNNDDITFGHAQDWSLSMSTAVGPAVKSCIITYNQTGISCPSICN